VQQKYRISQRRNNFFKRCFSNVLVVDHSRTDFDSSSQFSYLMSYTTS